jgi:hypothetical protein
MRLFTDAGLVDISDLELYESTLSKVVSTHNINIESKITITLATISDRLLARLIRSGAANLPMPNSAAPTRYNIVSLPPQTSWALNLDHVVVTDPLKRWISYELLSQIFAEAYSVQLNDRFREKWADYAARSKDAEQNLYSLGIGIVYQPLAQPALPTITFTAGNLLPGIVTVQTTWTDSKGNEGSPSPLVPVTLSAPAAFSVSPVAAQKAPPAAAAGWNVYVAANSGSPMKQNTIPIPLTNSWNVPSFGLVAGSLLSLGQDPDCYVFDPQRLARG